LSSRAIATTSAGAAALLRKCRVRWLVTAISSGPRWARMQAYMAESAAVNSVGPEITLPGRSIQSA
jgi:hypothetical protein